MRDKDVQRLWKWDIDAFGILYESSVNKIYNFLFYKTFDQSLAEDLTQETFFKALKKIDTFHGETAAEFNSWIYAIAYHVSVDHFRSAPVSDELDESLETASVSPDFGKDIDYRLKLTEVMGYLDTFSNDQKEILIMRIWDDLSYAEIAEITGKTVDTCKKTVSRILMKIQSNIAYLCIFAHFLTYISQ